MILFYFFTIVTLQSLTPIQAVKRLTAEAQKNASSSDDVVAAEAKIELEVLESLAFYAK